MKTLSFSNTIAGIRLLFASFLLLFFIPNANAGHHGGHHHPDNDTVCMKHIHHSCDTLKAHDWDDSLAWWHHDTLHHHWDSIHIGHDTAHHDWDTVHHGGHDTIWHCDTTHHGWDTTQHGGHGDPGHHHHDGDWDDTTGHVCDTTQHGNHHDGDHHDGDNDGDNTCGGNGSGGGGGHHDHHGFGKTDGTNTGASNAPPATIHIYPDPVVGSSVMRIENAKDAATFRLYESTGRQVMLKTDLTNGDNALEKGNLSPGLYFYQFIDGTTIVSGGSIVIQ